MSDEVTAFDEWWESCPNRSSEPGHVKEFARAAWGRAIHVASNPIEHHVHQDIIKCELRQLDLDHMSGRINYTHAGETKENRRVAHCMFRGLSLDSVKAVFRQGRFIGRGYWHPSSTKDDDVFVCEWMNIEVVEPKDPNQT